MKLMQGRDRHAVRKREVLDEKLRVAHMLARRNRRARTQSPSCTSTARSQPVAKAVQHRELQVKARIDLVIRELIAREHRRGIRVGSGRATR